MNYILYVKVFMDYKSIITSNQVYLYNLLIICEDVYHSGFYELSISKLFQFYLLTVIFISYETGQSYFILIILILLVYHLYKSTILFKLLFCKLNFNLFSILRVYCIFKRNVVYNGFIFFCATIECHQEFMKP